MTEHTVDTCHQKLCPVGEYNQYLVDLADGVLGRGAFGNVYKGINAKTQECVAVKRITVFNPEEELSARKEIRALALPNHRNIVQMLESCFEKQSCWIVMEFCDLGDMQEYFKKMNPDEAMRANLMQQSALGVEHLHCQIPPIVHRDLKLANIMLKSDSRGLPVVKIADFGLAKLVDTFRKMSLMDTITGSLAFMAPELHASQSYTKTVDVFALGLVFLVMTKYGREYKQFVPLCEHQVKQIPVGLEMLEATKKKRPLPSVVNAAMSDSEQRKHIKSLIRRMTAYNPLMRPTMKEVVEDIMQIKTEVIVPSETSLLGEGLCQNRPNFDEGNSDVVESYIDKTQVEMKISWKIADTDIEKTLCKLTDIADSHSSTLLQLEDYAVDLIHGIRGRGTFGTYYEGIHQKTKAKIAMKRITVKSGNDLVIIMKELRVLENLSYHENILNMYNYFYANSSFWFCMEYCSLGDMQEFFVSQDDDIKLFDKIRLMQQTSHAVHHLHTMNPPIVHRDIKPANIMLRDGLDKKPVVKITEFGLAKWVDIDSSHAETSILLTVTGTPNFMAPELFARLPYNMSVDVFALGLVFLAMVNFQPGDKELVAQFEDSKERQAVGQVMHDAHCSGVACPKLVSDLSTDSSQLLKLKALIREMACEHVKDRIRIADVVSRMVPLVPGAHKRICQWLRND